MPNGISAWDLYHHQEAKNSRLREQNTDLLAALEGIMPLAEAITEVVKLARFSEYEFRIATARAAIAKAKEKIQEPVTAKDFETLEIALRNVGLSLEDFVERIDLLKKAQKR